MAQPEETTADCPRCKKLLNIIEKNEQINCDCCSKMARVLCYDCNIYLCHDNYMRHPSSHKTVQLSNIPAMNMPHHVIDCNGQPWGIAFNKDGTKWAVADNSNHCVYLYNDEGQHVQTFGSKGVEKGEFNHPEGITFDGSNYLYVVDNSNHRVQKLDVDSMQHVCMIEIFGAHGRNLGQLDHPHGITICDDVVYVADTGNQRISVFKTNGVVCDNFGSEHLGKPHDVAVLRDKRQLCVADYDLHCIHIFTLDGKYITKFGTKGNGINQMNFPYSLTTDLQGYLVLADAWNHRIQVFNADDYQCVRCFGSYGDERGQFDCPSGIAVSPDGRVFVSDRYNKRIQIFVLHA